MTLRTHRRPTVEHLEDRWVPTVSARIIAGDVLKISGSASNPGNTISVVQTSPGGFTVSDGAAPVFVSTPGTVNDLLIVLGTRSDNVFIDLGGFTLNGSVTANLGISGTNTLSVNNGTIADSLRFTGGLGRDTLTVGAGVRINNDLFAATLFGNDRVTLDPGTVVGDRAVFNLDFGNDRLDLNGTIGDGSGLNLIVDAGFGNDQVNLNAGFVLNGDGRVFMNFGNDRFSLSDLAIINGHLSVNGGFGFDDYTGIQPRVNVSVRGFET